MSEKSGEYVPLPPLDLVHEKKEKDPHYFSRRIAVGAGAVASAVGLGRILGIKGAPEVTQKSEEVIVPNNGETLKLENDIVYLKKDEEGNLSYSSVAEYFPAKFTGVVSRENDNKVVIRTEPRVRLGNEIMIPASDINDREISVMRVASKYANGTQDNPEYCFKVIENNTPKFIYEWFALVRTTSDKENPHVFVSPSGETIDKPLFVGPNFVSRADEPNPVNI